VDRFLSHVERFISKKLALTVAAVALVAGMDYAGQPLAVESLDAVMSLVLGLVGAQGTVDAVQAWKVGSAVADGARAVSEAKEAMGEAEEPDGTPA